MSSPGKSISAIAYIGGLLGLTLLVVLMVRSDLGGMLRVTLAAGWPLLWVLPYRGLFYLLYTWGWLRLIHPVDPDKRIHLPYVLWATAVREGIDRLLPVASMGGGVVGVRMLRWRGLDAGGAAAGVIVEMVLTFMATYLFTAFGLLLLLGVENAAQAYDRVLLVLILTLPAPVLLFVLLRQGSVFTKMENYLRPMVGMTPMSEGAASLDRELRAALDRHGNLLVVTLLHLLALLSGSFEVWLALRLFGHPVSAADAVILESMCQALRTMAFLVPAGLGVQEAGLVIFGHLLGISSELALAVSLAKRMREVLCGLPALASWQWVEGRRMRDAWVR
jgi:putative membrane protein